MNTYFKEILHELEKKSPLVQITIIEHNGSTPRTAGTKMLLKKDNSILGTVGGGLYEGKALEIARQMLESAICKNSILYFNMQTKTGATDMDMICGGELRLLLEYIPTNPETIALYTKLVTCEEHFSSAHFITKIEILDIKEENSIFTKEEVNTSNALIFLDKLQDSININKIPVEIVHSLKENTSKEIKNVVFSNAEFCFHTMVKPHRLHIFGAGHVSCELAKIAEYLDFKTYVLDDRQEFANTNRFPNASVFVLDSLEQASVAEYLNQYALDEQDGIIIVTRGHARDRDVLMAALALNVGYVGMIGSKSKKASTYANLMEKGYKKEDLDKVHSPIGLSIGAQSPEEIAISISAELIAWRARKL